MRSYNSFAGEAPMALRGRTPRSPKTRVRHDQVRRAHRPSAAATRGGRDDRIQRVESSTVRELSALIADAHQRDEMAAPSYLHGNPLVRWLFWQRLERAVELLGLGPHDAGSTSAVASGCCCPRSRPAARECTRRTSSRSRRPARGEAQPRQRVAGRARCARGHDRPRHTRLHRGHRCARARPRPRCVHRDLRAPAQAGRTCRDVGTDRDGALPAWSLLAGLQARSTTTTRMSSHSEPVRGLGPASRCRRHAPCPSSRGRAILVDRYRHM